jgi:PKD repeat protein
VTLTVTDANSLSDSEVQAVTVSAAPPPENILPTAAFEYACVDLACTFSDRSTDTDGTVASWAWAFGTAGTSNAASPSFSFPSPGTYDVALTVTDNAGGTATARRTVTVNVVVHAAFTAADTTGSGNRRTFWKASVTIAVHGSAEQPIAGATVNASWSGAWTRTVSCVTSSNGQCTFTTGKLNNQSTSVTLTLTGVSAASSVYDSSANHNDVGSGSGTAITIIKP